MEGYIGKLNRFPHHEFISVLISKCYTRLKKLYKTKTYSCLEFVSYIRFKNRNKGKCISKFTMNPNLTAHIKS